MPRAKKPKTVRLSIVIAPEKEGKGFTALEKGSGYEYGGRTRKSALKNLFDAIGSNLDEADAGTTVEG